MGKIKDFIHEKLDAIDERELEEDNLYVIADEVIKTFHTQCKVFEAGSYDNPGYSITGYVISYLDENNELQGISVDIEDY